MDLGGASTQIAFAIEDDLNGPDYMHIQLYGYPYNVYTHSFLCYGKNEAEKKVLDKVLRVHNLHLVLCVMLRLWAGSAYWTRSHLNAVVWCQRLCCARLYRKRAS